VIYSYRCPDDHVFDRVRSIAHRNKPVRCPECGKVAKRDQHAELAGTVHFIPDVPEHFNKSTDCVIRSRRHLREIQKQRGLSDYDPKSHDGPPSWWK